MFRQNHHQDAVDPVVAPERVGLLRWEASSLGLVNPRLGLTRDGAARRARHDLDHEWHTGHVARQQRWIRRTADPRRTLAPR